MRRSKLVIRRLAPRYGAGQVELLPARVLPPPAQTEAERDRLRLDVERLEAAKEALEAEVHILRLANASWVQEGEHDHAELKNRMD